MRVAHLQIESVARDARAFHVALGIVTLLGLALRVGYLTAQPEHDPFFSRPILDGEMYVEWARAIVAGTSERGSAYYHAPLQPYFLALVFALGGTSLAAVFAVQQALSVASGVLAGLLVKRRVSPAAGVATAALFLFHHPLVFFASTPMGETLALFLMIAGLFLLDARFRGHLLAGGIVLGLAAVARPNLLLVPALFVVGRLFGGAWKNAALVVAGVALAVLPVSLRNLVESGHPVLISAQGGLAIYHGNGPGATGVYKRPAGFTGEVKRQREEATALASARTGRALDPVEADSWWGGQGIRTRIDDPLGTLRLVGWRALLLIDDHEHGLDYDPLLDTNPWRPVLRFSTSQTIAVPFALLFGLALAGLVALGGVKSGGWLIWSSVLACAATPVLFYVSCRYRLPTSAALTLPAGVGLAALCGWVGPASRARRLAALGALALGMGLSLAVPSSTLARSERAMGLSNRAGLAELSGDLDLAERLARDAVALEPGDPSPYFNLAHVLQLKRDLAGAEANYVSALQREPGLCVAASNLAEILFQQGRFAECVPFLRRATERGPPDVSCWRALIFAHLQCRDTPGARAVLDEATRRGIKIDAVLVQMVEAVERR